MPDNNTVITIAILSILLLSSMLFNVLHMYPSQDTYILKAKYDEILKIYNNSKWIRYNVQENCKIFDSVYDNVSIYYYDDLDDLETKSIIFGCKKNTTGIVKHDDFVKESVITVNR